MSEIQIPRGAVVCLLVVVLSGLAFSYLRSTDSLASLTPPRFQYPSSGDTEVDPNSSFKWSSVRGAETYQLLVGTSPGGNDIFSSGELRKVSCTVPELPSGQTLYARVIAKSTTGESSHSGVIFASGGTHVSGPTPIYPVDSMQDVDSGRAFEWSKLDLAQAYRLEILFHQQTLHDSGEISVTRRFVRRLPVDVPLSARLSAKINGQWLSTEFSFKVRRNQPSPSQEIESAFWATDLVRRMADDSNMAYSWTMLPNHIPDRMKANCLHFARALVAVLDQLNVAGDQPMDKQPRLKDVCLNCNGHDGHTLVEMYDPRARNWLVLDPTFDLTMKRRKDGGWATAADARRAAVKKDWKAIAYVFLGEKGDSFARNYYIDYPLLFLNAPDQNEQINPVRDYYEQVPLPLSQPGFYALQSSKPRIETVIDERLVTKPLYYETYHSPIFFAHSISLPVGSTDQMKVYRPRRFVFFLENGSSS